MADTLFISRRALNASDCTDQSTQWSFSESERISREILTAQIKKNSHMRWSGNALVHIQWETCALVVLAVPIGLHEHLFDCTLCPPPPPPPLAVTRVEWCRKWSTWARTTTWASLRTRVRAPPPRPKSPRSTASELRAPGRRSVQSHAETRTLRRHTLSPELNSRNVVVGGFSTVKGE